LPGQNDEVPIMRRRSFLQALGLVPLVAAIAPAKATPKPVPLTVTVDVPAGCIALMAGPEMIVCKRQFAVLEGRVAHYKADRGWSWVR
jgi:hypothetical protein